MKLIFCLISATLLAACVVTQSGYEKFYSPLLDPNTLQEVELLAEGEEPLVIKSTSLDNDISMLMSKKYIPIGRSAFNGVLEDEKNVISQAKRLGAKVVLTNARYTNTESSTYSGYGDQILTSNYSLHDQTAIYFVKSNQKYRFGIKFRSLTQDDRIRFGRNTGAVVLVVIEGSPAFNANIIGSDLLVSVDGQAVTDPVHAVKLLNAVPEEHQESILRIIRNGVEKDIRVKL